MKRRSKRGMALPITALLAAALLWACQSTPQASRPAPLEKGDWEALRLRLTKVIEEEMKANGVVGLSIALVDDQQTAWSRGFGFADREAGIEATGETAYRIGSVSKLFIATAVMQLVEEGLVELDRPYAEAVPGFSVRSRFSGADAVTVRHLLTHHSGLPDISRPVPRNPGTGMLVLPDFSEDSLSLPPGLMFSYSNVGYRLLGGLVESASGQAFSRFIDEHILQPLGMTRSSFSPETAPVLSKGYAAGKPIEPPPTYDPAGSLVSTTDDLAKFMQMVFAGGEAAGKRVIGAETLQEMLVAQNGHAPLDMDFRIGLGWHLFDLRGLLPDGTRAAGHSGFDTIYTSFLLVLPDQKLGVAVLCNSDSGGSAASSIAFRAIALMHEARTGVPVDPLPLPKEDTTSEASLPAAELERYAGFYETNGNDPFIEVRLEEGRLVSVMEGKKVQIVPLAGGRFSVRWLLLGFIPLRLAELERSTFSFDEIAGSAVIVEHRGPFKRLAGTRLEKREIPAGWKGRRGKWDCIDPGNGMVQVRSLELREHSGFLVLNVKTFATVTQGSLPWSAVLQPLSGTEAIVPGLQHSRSAGETLRAVEAGGGELLRFQGNLFRRAGKG